jgi:hypothetical protein
MARARYRQKDTDLTVEFLRELWDSQNGRCPLTGWKMVLPPSTKGWTDFLPENASLDKVDPKQGYLKGNVRFISVMANYAKHLWTDEYVLDFCRAVVQHHA